MSKNWENVRKSEMLDLTKIRYILQDPQLIECLVHFVATIFKFGLSTIDNIISNPMSVYMIVKGFKYLTNFN